MAIGGGVVTMWGGVGDYAGGGVLGDLFLGVLITLECSGRL